MRIRIFTILLVLGLFCMGTGMTAFCEEIPTFSTPPKVTKVAEKVTVNFTVSKKTDVEVAILGADGKVACHLVAGVLGGETPPPAPLKAGLAQSIEYGEHQIA